MPPGAVPEVPLEFNEQQDQVVREFAKNVKLAGLVTLALGGVSMLTGLILWFWWWESFWGGLFAIVVGATAKLMGLVLLSTASDAGYITETQGYDKIHMLNAFKSINLWLQVQIGLASLIGVVLVVRLFA